MQSRGGVYIHFTPRKKAHSMAVFLFNSCGSVEKTKTTGAAMLLVIPVRRSGGLTPNMIEETLRRDEDIPYADAGDCHMTRCSCWHSRFDVFNGANFSAYKMVLSKPGLYAVISGNEQMQTKAREKPSLYPGSYRWSQEMEILIV